MRTLSRRWESTRYIEAAGIYRTFLSEVKSADNQAPLAWACIETYVHKSDGPYRLEIWDGAEEEWEFVGDFSTIKQAKAVGRLLAGVALTKNF